MSVMTLLEDDHFIDERGLTCNVTLVPQRGDQIIRVDSSLEQGRLPVRVNVDGSQLFQVDLDSLELPQGGGQTMTSIHCYEIETIRIAVFNLSYHFSSTIIFCFGDMFKY